MIRKTLVAAGLVFLAAGASAQDATLDEVLQCHYETIGGLEAWQDLQSMEASGTMTLAGGQMQADFTMYAKRPRMQRVDFTLQGMTGTQAFDGEHAWMLMPFMGQTEAEPMPEDQAESMSEEADFDGPLIGYEDEGIGLELMGTEDVDGTPAYKIQVTMPSGDVRYYYLETDYCLPIKVEGEREQAGQKIQFETIMGDYKDVDGLVMAHSVETRVPGMPQANQTMTLENIELNVELPDSLFTMPEPDSTSAGQ
jgi:outer membrane lipoprotein-sorting protein